jgi:hypothetical protein
MQILDRSIQLRAEEAQIVDHSGSTAHGFAARIGHSGRMRAGALRVCSLVNSTPGFFPIVGPLVASRPLMATTLQSQGSEHRQAAIDHELAARQHRAAAEFHDRNMTYAARMSAEHAKASCITAHRHSMSACEHSEHPEASPAK